MCCARAIVTAKAKIDQHPKWESVRKGCGIQKTLAEELHLKANVPLRRCDIEDIKAFQSVLPDYQIHVISKEAFNAVVFKGPEANKKIYLYLHDGHYDVITTMAGFLGRVYFCTKCNKGYNTKENHTCNEPCICCHKCHKDLPENWKHCVICNRNFKNETCFNLHIQVSSKGNSTCKTYYRCQTCSVTVNRNLHKKGHVCGEQYCNVCKEFQPEGHHCFMKTVERKKKQKDVKYRYIFFDFECSQDERLECDQGYQLESTHSAAQNNNTRQITLCQNCQQKSCGVFKHVPTHCIAQKVCENCNDDKPCKTCGEFVFDGPNARDDFCKWLFSEDNEGTKVFCHNFKGYDSYPIISYLYENAILPEVIMNGSKFMSIYIPHLNMRFLDSMNFIPMALAKIPKAFGLSELTKGTFPHLFNKRENQDVILDHLPDVSYYNPDGMMPEDRVKFLQWYEEHRNDFFDFQEEILKYCRSDVDILRRGCLKFRDIFMNMTARDGKEGIDPFQQCITIASACNLVFRTLFLEEDTIGIIPPQGYRPKDRQSIKAMQWIKYVAHTKGLNIQHAGNFGEKVIGPYKVDGYYETPGEKVVMEFHGDFWHGNPKSYANNTVNKVVGATMGELYQRTLDKKKFIESQGYTYVQMWESDFDKEVESNAEMKLFVEQLELVSPLQPRDAFFGGRTEAFKLHAEAQEDTQIKYFDVTSLYPFINKTGKIPLGHPNIITENFNHIDDYEGLIKCKILPPRGLHIPVLPTKVNGKLLFGLCRTCMTDQSSVCTHSDSERMLTGTWVTDEVKKAIEKGYILDKIHEVWHFDHISQYDPEKNSGGLFTEYVNTFLKMKQEASGWPDHCNTEAEKQKYIADYYEKEGIKLEYDNIEFNAGLRNIGKLMLNSFWGKMGQRENMPQTTYISDPCEYFDMLTSDSQQVTDVSYVSDEMVRMQWVLDDDFIETSGRTNVVIAAYTTAQARLKLYSYLEPLDSRMIYADTDSVVFTVKPGEWEPPLDDFLGGMTDVCPGQSIVSFVTGGPKNYGFVTEDDKGKQATHCKVKGITLNYKNALDINYNVIKAMVMEEKTEDMEEKKTKVTVRNDFKIARDTKSVNIITKTEEKDYKLVFNKRVLKKDLSSVPYGM